ncbi:MAG: DNA polymerase III subunit psi [Alteromonadaceae bacterium]|jgi:DNA polymerase III psi subunit
MAITKRQFSQLQAMGIDLWQLKNTAKASIVDNEEYLDIELPSITEKNIFNDIVNSLGLSIGEISSDENSISLGLLSWQFSLKNEISLTHQHLITPSLNVLENSPELKKALWQTLQDHSII